MNIEYFINPVLTIILIAIYWYCTKIQNSKIKAQSNIINDLKEQIKFFDLKKISEYLELRDSEKDKLIDISKKVIKKEFELQQKEFLDLIKKNNSADSKKYISKEMCEAFIREEYIIEPYAYIAKNLLFNSESEINEILDKEFPISKEFILKIVYGAQKKIKEETGINDLNIIKILSKDKIPPPPQSPESK